MWCSPLVICLMVIYNSKLASNVINDMEQVQNSQLDDTHFFPEATLIQTLTNLFNKSANFQACNDTFFHDTIVSQYSCHDTIHYITTKCLVSCSWASEVCTADKPYWKHAYVYCVHHLEHNAKHCSAWVFLVSLFGKSSCIRTKKRKEGEH